MSPFRILLVDDNEQDRDLARRELLKQFPDILITSVGTKKSFTQALKRNPYDLAITDYHLPWSDGLALFQRIRERNPLCPVILYTGSGNQDTASRALEAGVDDYVVKSVDHLPQLMMSVRLALGRKAQQQAAAEAKDRLQHLVQALPIGLLFIAPGGHLLDANPRMTAMLGYPDRENLLSQKRVNFFENDAVQKEFHRLLREKKTLAGYEARLRRKDGSLLWCRFFAHPVEGVEGSPSIYEALVEDIQERKQAEEDMRLSESRMGLVYDSVSDMLMLLEVEAEGKYRVVKINRAVAEITGLSEEALTGKTPEEFLEAPVLRETAGRIGEAIQTKKSISFHLSTRPSGQPRLSMEVVLTPIPDSAGIVRHILVVARDITARIKKDLEIRHALHALRESERRYRTLAEAAHDMIFILNRDLIVEYVNSISTKMFNRSTADIVGRPMTDLFPPDVAQRQMEIVRRILEEGEPVYQEDPSRIGEYDLWVGTWLVPMRDASGRISSVLGVARDISERVRSEKALRESEHRYRTLAEAAHDMIFILNRDLVVEYINSFASLMFNRPVAEIIGRPMADLFPPDVAKLQTEVVHDVFEGGDPVYREDPSWIGGRELWTGTWLVPMRGADGRVSSVLGVARDISERIKAEKALRESEEQYRSLVQTSPDAIFLHGSDTRFSFANQQALDILGYSSPQELHEAFLTDLVQPEERALAESHLQTLLRTGSLRNAMLSFLRKDGSAVPMEINASLIRDEAGGMKGITSILRDITERRKREKALMEGEARFRAIFEKAAVGILLIGLDGCLLDGNQAICDILQRPHDELVGRSLEEFTQAEDFARGKTLFEDILNNRRDHYRQEVRLSGKDNQWIWCRLTVSAVKNIRNEPSFMIGMAEDISKQLEAEQTARQTAEALRRYAERLQILHTIDRAILEARTPEEIAQATLEKIHELLPSHRSSVVLFDFSNRTAAILSVQKQGDSQLEKGKIIPFEDYGPEIPRLQAGELVAKEDLLAQEELSPTEKILREDGIRSVMSIPLISQQELIGVLNISSGIPGAFTREHAEIASEVADLLAVAIRQARLFNQVRRHTLELESIAGLNRDLRMTHGRAEIPAVIVRHTAQILDCDTVILLTADPNSEKLLIEQSIGPLSPSSGTTLPARDCLTAKIAAAGKPYRLNAPLDKGETSREAEWLRGLASAACMPMASRGALIGALWAGRTSGHKGGVITDEDLRLLESIAEVSGNSLHRAALHEQTERRLRRLSALRAVDMAISASIDLRVTLSVLLDQVTSQLGMDAAAIRLLKTPSQSLIYLAGRGIQSVSVMQTPLQLGQGYAGIAALEHRVVSVSLWADDENAYARLLRKSEDRFASYFVAPLLAKGRIKGILELFHRSAFQPDEEWIEYMETMATQAAIAIDNASMFEDVQKTNIDLVAAYDATIEGWSRAMELRDRETPGHTQRVTDIAVRLARIMGIPEDQLVHVRRGALLHDIGKMAIPDSILLKPDPLSAEEMAIMRQHPVHAYEMLYPIAYLRPALDIPYCHHERWDGSGYPRGLEKEHIPLAARVFAIIDVWDTLRSDRPYCNAWPEEKARRYLHEQSGKQFDPAVVEAFFTIVDDERA